MATGGGKRCGRCEAPLRGRPQCPRCGTLNQGVAQPSGRPPVLGATPAQPSPPPPPPQSARLTLGQKLHARLRTAAFLFVGLVWVIGGIGFTISPLGGAWGLLGTLYGFYVLSGLLTGGSRFLLY
jgi:hypothetical protein